MAERKARSIFYPAPDGLRLHIRAYGLDHEALPVVCLPGLTRNARDFEGLALRLAEDDERPRPVLAFDYRGRGLSDYDPDWRRYDLMTELADVLAGLNFLNVARAAFVGTSRGGLIIQLLAATRPEMISAAVLNDVGPELGRAGLKRIADYLAAPVRAENPAQMVAAQRAIHGAAFPVLDDSDWERFARALTKPDGFTPDFDPALRNVLGAVDWSKPLPDLWPQFAALEAIPLTVIRGEHSQLLTEATIAEMARRHPSLKVVVAVGQGHAPLLNVGGLADEIAAFVRGCERP